MVNVIVVGAGIVGSSVAYRLAQSGAKVSVLEADRIGGGTSGTSFAWTNSNGKTPRAYHDLRERFLDSFRAELARHGVDASRLIISMNALPTRSDIVELWKVSDSYLDSFPFAGVNSTVDPLDAGVPVVIWEGEMFRSRMAGSLLRELKLEEYIAHSEEEYIALAVRLATDAQLRGEVVGRIRQAMADNPCFYDRRNFSAEVGKVLEQAAADFSR